MLSQKDLREYKRLNKAKEREIEKQLKTYHAWEQMPGESYKEFKHRFTSKKVFIGSTELK